MLSVAKTNRIRTYCAILAAAILLLLCGCSEELTGKWRSSEQDTRLTFSATGKVIMSSDELELTGSYTTEGDLLVMQLTAPAGQLYVIEATFTIEDKVLYLENSKGQIEAFVR